MILILLVAAIVLFMLWSDLRKQIIPWLVLAWATAWGVVAMYEPSLWPVALLGFVQNVAFTFVSRGRNSGSLGYHLVASIFSNGIYAALLFTSIDMIAQAKSQPAPFLIVYTLTTMAGSIFAHWLAMRVEKGKAKSVQADKFAELEQRLDRRISNLTTDVSAMGIELYQKGLLSKKN